MPVLTFPLTSEGPVIDVQLGVSVPRAAALSTAGLPVPPGLRLRMLIDTGASGTCIEAGFLATLGILPTGYAPMHTPSTAGIPVSALQYDASLTILHPDLDFQIKVLPVLECQPLGGGIQGLLGRDVLMHCLLVYNGESKSFSLAF